MTTITVRTQNKSRKFVRRLKMEDAEAYKMALAILGVFRHNEDELQVSHTTEYHGVWSCDVERKER